jgi:hypothetical protein
MDGKLTIFDRNMSILDDIILKLHLKSSEIKIKVTQLSSKTNLHLADSTEMLKFQNIIILNDLSYVKNLKHVIIHNVHDQLYLISENITMVCVSYLNIYKDINDTSSIIIGDKHSIKMSTRKDHLPKIVLNISLNMSFMESLLKDLKDYTDKLSQEMTAGNFHCKTLHDDLNNKYAHINAEFECFQKIFDKTIDYFTQFTDISCDQLQNPKRQAYWA